MSLEDVVGVGVKYNQKIQESDIKRRREGIELRLAEESYIPRVSFSNSILYYENETLGVEDNSLDEQIKLTGSLNLSIPYIASVLSLSAGISMGDKYQLENKVSKSYNVSYTQPLLKGLWSSFKQTGLRKAEMDALYYQYDREKIFQETIIDLLLIWFQLLLKHEEVNVADENVLLQEKIYQANLKFKEVGKINRADLEKSEIDLENAKIEKQLKEKEFENVTDDLLEEVGIEPAPGEKVQFVFDKELLSRSFVLDKSGDELDLMNNYDVLMLDAQLRKTYYELIENKDQLLFDINLKVSYGESFYERLESSDQNFNVSLNFNIPFYRLEEEYRLQQTEEKRALLEIQKQYLLSEHKKRLKKNDRDLELIYLKIDFLNKKIANQKRMFEDELTKWSLGRSELLKVSQFKNDYLNSEKELIELRVEKINYELEWYRLKGIVPQSFGKH